MRIPDPKANTTTEAYLAYKAGFLEESELKPSLYEPYLHFDAWLAYWAGLTNDYPLDKNGDPEMLTDEEALVAYLSGVTNTYPEEIKDPYDVRIVGYLKHLVSVRWPEPEYPVNNEEFYLSTMKPTFVPSGDTPSSDIEMDGTAEAPFIDLKMYGDTYQQAYSGKNLFDSTRANTYFDTDKTFVTHSGAYTTSNIPASTGDVFTLSCSVSSNGLVIASFDSNNTCLKRDATGSSLSITHTCPTNTAYIIASNNKYTAAGQETQLESGSTATSFEPYVGGIASPNPDYPQDINVVTGEQTVKVNGKNLLVISNGSRTENGITWTRNGNTFVGNGTKNGTSNWSAMTAFIDFSTPLPAGTYTLSIKSPVQKAIEFAIRDSSNVDITFPKISVGKTSVTFTTTREASNFRVVSLDMTSGETLTNYTVPELQLEAGSSVTNFELPQWHTLSLGSTELCKIDDYQDYIYRDADGDWYVHKEVGKVTYSGSGGAYNSENNWYYVGVPPFPDTPLSNSPILSDCFTGATASEMVANPTNGLAAITSNTYVLMRNTSCDTVEEYRTWLGVHNPVFYYVLAAPTETQITDSTLVEQLDALMEGGSYEGKTYIKVTATEPNLPGLLYVEAGKYD